MLDAAMKKEKLLETRIAVNLKHRKKIPGFRYNRIESTKNSLI